MSKDFSLKLNFFTDIFKVFDHNYYSNSLKYEADKTLFPIKPVTLSTKGEGFSKGFFNKCESNGK